MLLRFKNLLLLLFLLAGLGFSVQGQGPGRFWYFGDSAGVDFLNGGAVGITDGKMVTPEACATISDSLGNLLFYSNGEAVWNAQHDTMPNGFGITGSSSSLQSHIILPYPGHPNEYFLFTMGAQFTPQELNYSIIDMTLDGGLGDVTSKNNLMTLQVMERITAVRHANGTDFWVVTHRLDSDLFMAYQVSASGVSSSPVMSAIGSNFNLSAAHPIGTIKFNNQGNRLVSTVRPNGEFEFFDFDANTGIISNLQIIPISILGMPNYAAFSPDDTRLYSSSIATGDIYQLDLTQPTAALISASVVSIGQSSISNIGANIQAGPNGKLYIAFLPSTYLSRIEYPNQLGVACNFNDSAVFLGGRLCRAGLPQFLPNSFSTSNFTFLGQCDTDSTQFFFADTIGLDSLKWNFGDAASGTSNTSTLLSPKHLFSSQGSFVVQMVRYINGLPDTLSDTVVIHSTPISGLSADTVLCQPDTFVLKANQDSTYQYFWSDSTQTDSLTITQAGKYWVRISNNCDTITDTIRVYLDTLSSFSLGSDTSLCLGNSIVLNPDLPPGQYLWSDSSTDTLLSVSPPDTVWLSYSNACGVRTDTIVVLETPIPTVSLPADDSLCFGETLVLSRDTFSSVTYQWSSGLDSTRLLIDRDTLVWLSASNSCGQDSDTIRIGFYPEIPLNLGADTLICEDFELILRSGVVGGTNYQWFNGTTGAQVLVNGPGSYWAEVTVLPCTVRDTIDISNDFDSCFRDIDCFIDIPNVFSPNNDGVNDLFLVNSDCNFTEFELSVYNRFGSLVFRSFGAGVGWDGYSGTGRLLPEGVYFYVFRFRDRVAVNADQSDRAGSVTLLR